MRAALPSFRIATVLTLVLAFMFPHTLFAEVVSGSPVSPAAALGLKIGGPIEIGLPDGSRVRGVVLEVTDSAAVIEYQAASGVVERQTIPFSAMQAATLPPKVDSWLDKYKWFVIIGVVVGVTIALLLNPPAWGQ